MSSITQSKQARGFNRRGLTWVLGVLVVALVLLVLDTKTDVLHPFKSATRTVFAPVELRLTQARLALGTWVGNVTHLGSQQRQIEALQTQLSEAQAKIVQLQALQVANDALAQQLGIEQVGGWKTLAAPVVQANVDNGRRMINIGKGRVDGVQVGMAVIAKEGGNPAALIGVVDVVYAQTADVLLITDGASSVSARTVQNVVSGLVVGQWQKGSRIQLDLVDRDVTLQTGDSVVTAGLSKAIRSDTPIAYIPANIPIGVILKPARNNRHQWAELQPFADPDRARNVWVILDEQKK